MTPKRINELRLRASDEQMLDPCNFQDDVLECLNEIDRLQKSPWHCTGAELPSEGQRVIVAIPGSGQVSDYYSEARFERGMWRNDNWHHDSDLHEYKFWMPIPSLSQKKEIP